MCNEAKLERWARQALNRREFGALGAAGAVTACASSMPGSNNVMAEPRAIDGNRVSVRLGDGTMDGYFVAPSAGEHPGVILWPDIASLRPVKMRMADRLAAEGYAVLVMNPYYRDVSAPIYEDFAAFAADQGFGKVRPWREKLEAEAIMSDANGAVEWLDTQDRVDTSRGIGTQGYCMGGPFAFWTAAAAPLRVKAVASFHGGGLVTDDTSSPHRTFDDTRASYLVAISQDDDAEDPDHKRILREAATEAGRPLEIEVYPADHGWTVPDSPAYDREQAERAYANLLALYRRAL